MHRSRMIVVLSLVLGVTGTQYALATDGQQDTTRARAARTTPLPGVLFRTAAPARQLFFVDVTRGLVRRPVSQKTARRLGYRPAAAVLLDAKAMPKRKGAAITPSRHPSGAVVKSAGNLWLLTATQRRRYASRVVARAAGAPAAVPATKRDMRLRRGPDIVAPEAATTSTRPAADAPPTQAPPAVPTGAPVANTTTQPAQSPIWRLYSTPSFKDDLLPYLARTLPASTGALGANRTLELAGKLTTYNVGIQGQGAELVIRGAVENDTSYVDGGLRAFDWALAKQTKDGGIPVGEPGDINVTHAILDDMFLAEGAARALLVLEQSDLAPGYADKIEQLAKKLGRLADWMSNGEWWDQYLRTAHAETVGNGSRGPLTHKFYLTAAALSEIGLLLGRKDLQTKGRDLVIQGLKYEDASGYNPEGGGYDTSYQVVGLTMAQHWLAFFSTDSLAPVVQGMLDRTLKWEAARVRTDGRINWSGNTRSCTPYERAGSRMKDPGYVDAQVAFTWWAEVRGKDELRGLAERLRAFRNNANSSDPNAPCW